jgi:hypothetical protein
MWRERAIKRRAPSSFFRATSHRPFFEEAYYHIRAFPPAG